MSILKTTVMHDTVNNDSNLHVFVTKYYYNKTKYWIKHSDKFNKYKDIKFKSRSGKKFIFNTLNDIVKKYDINWYDLRKFHTIIKLFIYKKLNKF